MSTQLYGLTPPPPKGANIQWRLGIQDGLNVLMSNACQKLLNIGNRLKVEITYKVKL